MGTLSREQNVDWTVEPRKEDQSCPMGEQGRCPFPHLQNDCFCPVLQWHKARGNDSGLEIWAPAARSCDVRELNIWACLDRTLTEASSSWGKWCWKFGVPSWADFLIIIINIFLSLYCLRWQWVDASKPGKAETLEGEEVPTLPSLSYRHYSQCKFIKPFWPGSRNPFRA